MKITLQPTEDYGEMERPPIVTIQTDRDDLNMEEVAELLRRVAIAWGFDPGTVKLYIPEK